MNATVVVSNNVVDQLFSPNCLGSICIIVFIDDLEIIAKILDCHNM